MNRSEKKYFVTVAAAHGLLLVILFVGPAFFVSPEKTDAFKPITAFDPSTISKLMTQGGTPQPVQAVPLPPPPTPTSEPKPVEPTPKPPEIPPAPKEKVKEFEPPKPEIKIKPVEHGDEPTPKPKHVVKINPEEMFPTSPNDKVKAQRQAQEDARARAAAREARQRAEDLRELGNAIKSIKNNVSGATMVSLPPGAGGGGAASVNYFQLVQSILDNAWHPSQTLGDDTPTATISITISRDGTVRGHVTKHSGNSSMDKSIQNVLDTVTSVEPFPPSFKEQQITASFTFDIKAKR